MAAPLSSRQNSPASQRLQKSTAICPSPCGSGLARDGSAAVFKAELAGKPAPTEKHRNLPLPLWERACPRWQRRCLQGRTRRQASAYRKASQSPASPCGSGLARDGSAAVFKAKLAGKPAPTEKHRNLPLPLWERACPRWQCRWLQGRARWQASAYRKTPQSAPPPVGAGLPAMAAPLAPSKPRRLNRPPNPISGLPDRSLRLQWPSCGRYY